MISPRGPISERTSLPLPPSDEFPQHDERFGSRLAFHRINGLARGDNAVQRSGMNALLEDLTSGDPHRVWSASGAIAKLRDAPELDQLAQHLTKIWCKTRGIKLGGLLFPNSEHLRFALRKLRYHRDQRGCLCRLYPEHLFFNPEEEAAAGNVCIEETTSPASLAWR